MKKLRSIILILITLTLSFFLKSCLGESYTYQDYLIKVDSIQIPDTITIDVPFDIKFYGVVGFDGCHSFKTFNQLSTENELSIETWGTYDNTNGTCPTGIVYLDGQNLNMTFHTSGIYNIKIIQPDNSSFVKEISVN